jgi:WD40 repeat protein
MNLELLGEDGGHGGAISSIQIDDLYSVSASVDSTVRVWNWRTEGVVVLRGHAGAVYCARFDANHKYVCSGGADSLAILWDLKSGQRLRTFCGHNHTIISLNFDHDKLVTGSVDKTLKVNLIKRQVWDLKSGHCLCSLNKHRDSVWNVSLTSTKILSASLDQTVLSWDFSS